MRYAIISDIHGNCPAFKKVLEDANKHNVDKFIFIGDYIFDMPFSNEVVQTIIGLKNSFVIAGNKERYLVKLQKESQENWTLNQMAGVYQTYRELNKEVFDFLIELKEELYITLDSGKVILATHFLKEIQQQSKMNCSSLQFHEKMIINPFSHQEYLEEFTETLNQDYTRNILNQIKADVILFGHNHLQGFGYCGEKLVINPGSCGQPLDFNNNASYTILEDNPNGFEVIERRVPYDIESTINLAKKSVIYEVGFVWSELCFVALRTGKDYFGKLFQIAWEISKSKNEQEGFFTNETWDEAYKVFKSLKGELY